MGTLNEKSIQTIALGICSLAVFRVVMSHRYRIDGISNQDFYTPLAAFTDDKAFTLYG